MERRRPACSKKHRRWCSPAHLRLVGEYRDQRDARDALRESEPYMQHEDDDFDAEHPRVTFKIWIVGHARPRG